MPKNGGLNNEQFPVVLFALRGRSLGHYSVQAGSKGVLLGAAVKGSRHAGKQQGNQWNKNT